MGMMMFDYRGVRDLRGADQSCEGGRDTSKGRGGGR